MAELIFEVQETLAELRACAGDGANSDLRAQVMERKQSLGVSLNDTFAELENNFAKWDGAVSANPELIVQLKGTLSRIAYLRTLLRDVDRELEGHDLG